MKKLALVLLICAAFCLSGCGLLQTAEERDRRLAQGLNLQMRALVDDADYILLFERPNYCSEYHIFSGYNAE